MARHTTAPKTTKAAAEGWRPQKTRTERIVELTKHFRDHGAFIVIYNAVPQQLKDSLSEQELAMVVDAMYEQYRAGRREMAEAFEEKAEREAAAKAEADRTRGERVRRGDPSAAARLSGSDKQVAWANDLRAKGLDSVRNSMARLNSPDHDDMPQETKDTIRRNCRRVIALMMAETSAKTIIDHRDDLVAYYRDLAKRES